MDVQHRLLNQQVETPGCAGYLSSNLRSATVLACNKASCDNNLCVAYVRVVPYVTDGI